MKNIRNLGLIASLGVLAWFGTGCASQGDLRGNNTGTQVELKGNNYKVIKAGAVGESTGFDLLGLIPIVPPTAAEAKVTLYRDVGEELKGRSIALANQTEDRSYLYLILFGIPKITITADVVEFTSDSKN
jgi:hypothetical protein